MIRRHDNPIKRSARSARAQQAPSSIETPACGYDWTQNSVRELASEIAQKTGRAIKFLFNKNTGQGDHQAVESKIFIAPTALLQERSDYPIYGAFAKTSFTQKLTYPYCLGEYQGALTKIVEEKEEHDEQEAAEESCLYTFNLGNGFELSAEHEGSWTRMINSASSEETANIYYERVNDKIYCYLKHPIRAGEQFLGYYGDAYEHENKRFIQSCDNWETSFERYQTHIALYRHIICGVERYAVPDIQKLTRETVNLPILKRLNHRFYEMSFLPQWQQENKTLLHWACETSNIELLKSVCELNSDISIQSRMSGQTALHAVLLNQALSSAQKIEFLDIILFNQPIRQLIAIVLQDKEEQSILHLAIEQEDVGLIAYILTTELQKRNYKDGKDIRNCLNKQGRDFILMALATGSLPVLDVIKAYMGAKDVVEILENHEEVLREIWNDIATRYDHAVLSQIKLFLASFVDPNDQEILQKLDACLPVDERHVMTEESSLNKEEVGSLCSPTISNNKTEVAVNSLGRGVMLKCIPSTSDKQMQAAGAKLQRASECSAYQEVLGEEALNHDATHVPKPEQISKKRKDTKIPKLVQKEKRTYPPDLVLETIRNRQEIANSRKRQKIIACEARARRICPSTISNNKTEVAVNSLGRGVMLKCIPSISDKQMQAAVNSQVIGGGVLCTSALSDLQIQLIASSLKKFRILKCDHSLSEHQIRLAAGSLDIGVALLCTSGYSDDQIRTAASALAPGRIFLSLVFRTPVRHMQLAAGSLAPGSVFMCDFSLSHEQLELVASSMALGTIFLCSPAFSDEQIQVVSASLAAGARLQRASEFSAYQEVLGEEALNHDATHVPPTEQVSETGNKRRKTTSCEIHAGHSIFNRRMPVRPGRDTPSLVRALSVYYAAVVKIDCSWMPNLSDKILQYIHVGSVVKLDPELQFVMIFLVVRALPLGTMLLLEKNLSYEQLFKASKTCSENTVIILDPLLSTEQLKVVASNLNPKAVLALRPCMSNESMKTVAVNLHDRANLTFYDSFYIADARIRTVSGLIRPGCTIETQPDMREDILSVLSKSACQLRVSRRLRYISPFIFRGISRGICSDVQVPNAASQVILSFKYDAHVNLCASWQDQSIIHMVRSTPLGFVVSLDRALSLDMIRQVASELPFGAMLLLDNELSQEQLQAAAQSCSAGGVIILDLLLSPPQLMTIASNMNTQSLLALRPCMSKTSMGTIAFYLKRGARLTFYDSDRMRHAVIEHTLKHLSPRCTIEVQPNMSLDVLFWVSKSLSKQHRLSLNEPISLQLNAQLKCYDGISLMLSAVQIRASLSGLKGTLLYPRYAKAWQHYAMIEGLPEGSSVHLCRTMDPASIEWVASNIKANTLVVLSHTITDEQFMAAVRGAVVARERSHAVEFRPVLLEQELEFRIGHPDGALSFNALERLERITEQEIESNACSMQFK